MPAGMLLAYSEIIARLFSGEDMVDSVWPHAVRSLEWTMALRASSATTLSLFFLAALAGYGLRAFVNSTGHRSPFLALPYAVVGALLALISLHFLLDVFYLRGAFLLLPTLMGWSLAAALVGLGGPPSLRSPGQDRISSVRLFQLFGVFFAAWLVMPGVPAVVGFAPAPPGTPTIGYGSFPAPYTLTQYRSMYPMPDEVVAVQGDLEAHVEFSVYVSLPDLPEDSP